LKILLTGGHGFVGRHLWAHLESSGHQVYAPTHIECDVTDRHKVSATVDEVRPDAIAHLAAISSGAGVQSDPFGALSVAIGGTANLFEAVRNAVPHAVVLVSGSSEVYGAPAQTDLPLNESAPVQPRSPYAMTKLAQESIAIAYAKRYGLRVVVTRAFNHSGAGQRPAFVIPALTERVRAVADGRASAVRVGNLHVRRDFVHVLDVVRAYRLIVELAVLETGRPVPMVVNVASGRAVAIRDVLDGLARLAGIHPQVEVDQTLVRTDDPLEIRGDATALTDLTGWRPEYTMQDILKDVWRGS
jgi:GDP-4-dehydro-6-deoxy-D-mannose reductase